MDIKTAIGEMFALSFSGPVITPDVRKLIVDDKVGTVLLFSNNFSDAAHLAQLSAQLRSLGTEAKLPAPLIVAIDQEGGDVQRVGNGVAQIPDEYDLGASGIGGVRSSVARMGCGLHQLGVVLDLAPVADLRTNPNDAVIGNRSFGSEADVVGPLVAAYITGLHQGGVGSTVKHFPGLGGAAGDPHTALPTDHETLQQWEQTQALSFASGIKAQTDAVMTTAVSVPSLDPSGIPAYFSQAVVTGLLRDKLDFNGVIISDSLSFGGISGKYPLPQAALAAAQAGNDLLLLSNSDPALEEQAVAAVSAAVQAGTIPVSQVRASAERVIALANRWGTVPATPNLSACG